MSYATRFHHAERRKPYNYGTWIGERPEGVIAGRFLMAADVTAPDLDLSSAYSFVGTDPRNPHNVLSAMWLQLRADGEASPASLRRLQIAHGINIAAFRKAVAMDDPEAIALQTRYRACEADAARLEPGMLRQDVSPKNKADIDYVIATEPTFPEDIRALGCLNTLEYHGPAAYGTPNEPATMFYDSIIATGYLTATASYYLKKG